MTTVPPHIRATVERVKGKVAAALLRAPGHVGLVLCPGATPPEAVKLTRTPSGAHLGAVSRGTAFGLVSIRSPRLASMLDADPPRAGDRWVVAIDAAQGVAVFPVSLPVKRAKGTPSAPNTPEAA